MNKTSSQEQRIDDLKSELAKITKELSKAPNGSLNAVKTSNGFKYFQIEKNHGNVKRTYIKKENIALATALAKKRYNKVRKHEIENEIASIKQKMDRNDPKCYSYRANARYCGESLYEGIQRKEQEVSTTSGQIYKA